MMKQAKRILMACAALFGVVQAQGDSGGDSAAPKPSVTMTRCRLTGNSSPLGSAFAAEGEFDIALTDTTVVSNTVTMSGVGGFYLPASGLTVHGNTVISDNAGGNLALQSNKVVTVADDFTGCIGVTLLTEPTLATPVTITGPCAEDQSARFRLDNEFLNLTNMTENTLVALAKTTEPIPSELAGVAKANVEVYTNGVISLDGTVWSNRTAIAVYTAKKGYAFEDGSTVYRLTLDTQSSLATNAVDAVLPKTVQTLKAVLNAPKLVNHRGLLTDAEGRKYADGVYTLDLRIWDSESGTDRCLWGARYSVFVTDGTFDVLLGNPNAQDLRAIDGAVPEYDKEDLWMVMLNEPSADGYYLGVTPHQDAAGQPIAMRAEISPRPKVMSAGFAFRALHAKYAEESLGDFHVGGKLTVEGKTTIKGQFNATGTSELQFGSISASGTEVKVGGAKSAAAAQPKVTSAANSLYLQSWGDTTFGATAGDVTLNAAAGHAIRVKGTGSFVSGLEANAIGGTGATTVRGKPITMQVNGGAAKYAQDANTISISGCNAFTSTSPYFSVNATAESLLKGTSVDFSSRGGARMYLNGNKVVGEGGNGLYWNYSGTYVSPFLFRTVSFRISNNPYGGKILVPSSMRTKVYWDASCAVSSDSSEWGRYNWFIAGWTCTSTGNDGLGYAPSELRVKIVNNQPVVYAYRSDESGQSDKSNYWGVNCTVTVMGIHKNLSRSY